MAVQPEPDTAPEPGAGEELTRDRVAVEDTWDLTPMYADAAAWDADAARIPALVAAATGHRETLGASAAALAAALDEAMALRETAARLLTYAALRRDEDTTADDGNARYERAAKIETDAEEALAFLRPGILAVPEDRLTAFLDDPALTRYRYVVSDIARHRPHVRSAEIEAILAQIAEVARIPGDAFGAFDNADVDFGRIADEDGTEVVLTHGRLDRMMESRNRDLRRRAHAAAMGAYRKHRHSLAALHGGSVRKDVVLARARGFGGARAAALFPANIPESVYDTLLDAVRAAGPVVGRYHDLRRRLLGVDELAVYDRRAPLLPEPIRHYGYREAVELVLAGLSPLGERYVADLRTGFASRWVDVHETKGKASGAYSWGAYGASPVILMNWNGTLTDVFTLAHEAGHAMHSHFAMTAQPFHDWYYPTVLAEIASTLNEVFLTWHLLDTIGRDDPSQRFSLLTRFVDGAVSTLVLQAALADFERQTHADVEAGRPLTADRLDELFGQIQAAFLPGLTEDNLSRIRWAWIPHFYDAFYVYQYATGLSAAIALARSIRDDGEPAVARFLDLLAAGGSDDPLALLKRAGVDLTTPDPVEAALAEIERTVAEMERLVASGAIPVPEDRAQLAEAG